MVGERHGRNPFFRPPLDDAESAAAGLAADEETWEIAFRGPRATAVEIRARAEEPSRRADVGGLAALPEAVQQDAMATVRSLGPRTVEIKTHRIKPLPIEAAPPGQLQTLRAVYQYDPRIESAQQSEPALVLTAVPAQSAPAWVWDCQVQSQFDSNGSGEHIVSYSIQNAGSRQVSLTLPPRLAQAVVHGVWRKRSTRRGLSRHCRCEPIDRRSARGAQVRHAGRAALDQRAAPGDLQFLAAAAAGHRSAGLYPALAADLPPGYAPCTYDATQSLELSDAASRVLVVRRAAIDAAGWIPFLLVIGFGALASCPSPFRLAGGGGRAGDSRPVVAGGRRRVLFHGFLGVVFCLVLALLRRRKAAVAPTAPVPRGELPSTLTSVVPFGAPLLVAAMLCGSSSAGETPKQPVVHSVFIPVDGSNSRPRASTSCPRRSSTSFTAAPPCRRISRRGGCSFRPFTGQP